MQGEASAASPLLPVAQWLDIDAWDDHPIY
jgi:hypothetical protein